MYIYNIRPSLSLILILFATKLQVPHRVQQRMSSECMPRLGSAVPCFELFMTAWESLATRIPRLRPSINVGLDWAKSYYVRMDLTDSYVIAMCKFFYFYFFDNNY